MGSGKAMRWNKATRQVNQLHFLVVANSGLGSSIIKTFYVRVAESGTSCCTSAFVARWGRTWTRRRCRAWYRAVIFFQLLLVRLEAFVIACAFFDAIITAPLTASLWLIV